MLRKTRRTTEGLNSTKRSVEDAAPVVDAENKVEHVYHRPDTKGDDKPGAAGFLVLKVEFSIALFIGGVHLKGTYERRNSYEASTEEERDNAQDQEQDKVIGLGQWSVSVLPWLLVREVLIRCLLEGLLIGLLVGLPCLLEGLLIRRRGQLLVGWSGLGWYRLERLLIGRLLIRLLIGLLLEGLLQGLLREPLLIGLLIILLRRLLLIELLHRRNLLWRRCRIDLVNAHLTE